MLEPKTMNSINQMLFIKALVEPGGPATNLFSFIKLSYVNTKLFQLLSREDNLSKLFATFMFTTTCRIIGLRFCKEFVIASPTQNRVLYS